MDREAIHRLIGADCRLIDAPSAEVATRICDGQQPDCVLLDYRLPDVTDLELLDRFVKRQIPVVMLTRKGNEAIAVEAMKRGAKDYLVKGQLSAAALQSSIRFAVEQQAAQSSLLESEANVRAIIESAMDCIIAIDGEGDIVDFNLAAQRTFGYKRHEVLGRKIEVLFPADVQERVRRNVDRYLSRHEAGSMIGRRLEFSAVRKDGTTFIAEFALQPITLASDAVLAMFLRDITHRKQAEATSQVLQQKLQHMVAERTAELREAYEQLQDQVTRRKRSERVARRHQQDLEHATRLNTLGEMASGMAHELNQPLTAIVAHAEAGLSSLSADGYANADVLDDLRSTVEQARRAGAIIKHLRALVGKRETEHSKFFLQAAIHDIAELVEADAKWPRVRTRIECENAVPQITADRIQIEQVLLNLIRNAIESTKDTTNPLVRVAVRKREDDLIVQVIDNGRGASANELARMFEPFYTTRAEGLGLGLSISQSIIEAHGGRLTAAANPERGLTVQFTLPLAESAGHDSTNSGR